jgi:hypothetical protein
MMKIGKNMIIAIMITFCFTATLLMVIPIRSANNSYDPWIDLNGDGRINMDEVVSTLDAFGTTGDPTRNVNVTNFPLDGQGNLKTTNYLPSGTFNASCKISIQTTSVVGNGGIAPQGIYITYVPSGVGASFFFIFDPLAPDFNVSRIVLQSIADSNTVQQAQIWLDSIYVGILPFATQNQPIVTAAPITQVQTLQQGMNQFTILPSPGQTILLQDLSLFVEYQYTR